MHRRSRCLLALCSSLIVAFAFVATVHAAQRLYLPLAFGPSPKPTATRVPSPTWEWITPTPAPTLAVRRTRDFTDPRTVKGVAAEPKTGDLWAATYGGVVRWSADGAHSDVFTVADGLPENYVTAVDVAGDGRVVVGTENGYGAVRLADGRWDAFEVPADPRVASIDPGLRRMSRIQTLAADAAGTTWFGTFDGVAARRSSGSWEYPPWPDPWMVAVPSIGADPNGGVWMGTMGPLDPDVDGLHPQQGEQIVVHRADGTWQTFDSRSGLQGGYWADVAVDAGGTVWALAENTRVDPQGNWLPWVERLVSGATAWAPPDFGDLGEVMRSVPGQAHAMALDARGRPWFLSDAGLLVPTDGDGRHWSAEPNDGPWGTNEDELTIGPDGTAWLGTGNHVVRRAADGTYRRLVPPGLPSGDVRAVVADADGAWFGTAAGLVRAHGDGSLDVSAARPGPAADAEVRDLAFGPDHSLWVATAQGVARRLPDGAWTSFTTADGLLVDATTALAVDRDGALWCIGAGAADAAGGTTSGARGVSTRSVDGTWRSWSAADGLPDLVPAALIARRDGAVWVSFVPPVTAPQVYDGDVLFRHDAGGWSAVAVPEELRIAGNQRMVEGLDGALWVSLGGVLARRDSVGQWTTWVDEHMWRFVGNALSIDPAGQLWMGGYDGQLYVRRTDGQWRTIRMPGAAFAPSVQEMAFGSDGQVWLALASVGSWQPAGARWLELAR